ncbi:MAG: MbnP family protein [Lentimonas sp.]
MSILPTIKATQLHRRTVASARRPYLNKNIISAFIFFILLASASPTHAIDLALKFSHSSNGQPLRLDSLRYTNTAEETYSVSRLSYLLSGFELQNKLGNWIPTPETYGYIDVAKRRDEFVLSGIPDGNYRAIRFHVGIAPDTNHDDPAQYAAQHPLNPNFNQLHWDWQTGYIFLALEGRYRNADQGLAGYIYHFANDPQRTLITLPLPQDITTTITLEIDFDIAALLNSPKSLSFSADGASTHSREGDPIVAALKANLPTAFQLKRIVIYHPVDAVAKPKPIDLPKTLTPYRFKMSARFPIPNLPTDNPLIVERVELGEKLFHDPILSVDSTISCASCHKEPHALSDNLKQSTGIDGQLSRRHSMPIFNLAWKDEFFWDGRAPSLREQALMPIQDPTEMGETLPNVVAKLKTTPEYPANFSRAFGSGEITAENIGLALESFLLSETSYNSKFDQAIAGKATLTKEEQSGLELFMTEFEPRSRQYGADCFHCHGGALFADHRFHDNGLHEINNDRGRAEVTENEADAFKFSTPSLRNVAITAPYMHDGRFETLEEVIEHYSSGVEQRETLDPNLAKHPGGGIPLSKEDKAALVAFLKTLTDPKY